MIITPTHIAIGIIILMIIIAITIMMVWQIKQKKLNEEIEKNIKDNAKESTKKYWDDLIRYNKGKLIQDNDSSAIYEEYDITSKRKIKKVDETDEKYTILVQSDMNTYKTEEFEKNKWFKIKMIDNGEDPYIINIIRHEYDKKKGTINKTIESEIYLTENCMNGEMIENDKFVLISVHNDKIDMQKFNNDDMAKKTMFDTLSQILEKYVSENEKYESENLTYEINGTNAKIMTKKNTMLWSIRKI